ncbi:glutathione synthase [Bartonella bilalgolemii]|uniref:Glutathione synthetase n=1 Tax=Bartonella bilalgolemii TaxID=2942911 RepID=A0ABT0PAT2_9HYPH|nr:glutathione synthase [Bartonella sp. G70]MCL6229943.1 glutathione synthase [Bartonella sp. G70]
MKIAIQMDHIATLKIQGDTTFALALAAQERGHSLFHYTPDRLFIHNGCVIARLEPLTVRDEEGCHYQLGESVRTELVDMDVVLLRQDPPFDMNYITTTHFLERIHPKTLIVNDPVWVRNSPEKIFVTEFFDLMPETLITKDIEEIKAFRSMFGDIIIKPLYGNGGIGVFHLKNDDRNFASLIEMFEKSYKEPFIVQRYLESIREGDKRIILLDGEPVGAINRIPIATDVRSNIHVGGRVECIDLTERDYEICARIGPSLKKRGLLLVGIDVIGDYITEINVTSPTGIREIKRFGGADIASLFWDIVELKRLN